MKPGQMVHQVARQLRRLLTPFGFVLIDKTRITVTHRAGLAAGVAADAPIQFLFPEREARVLIHRLVFGQHGVRRRDRLSVHLFGNQNVIQHGVVQAAGGLAVDDLPRLRIFDAVNGNAEDHQVVPLDLVFLNQLNHGAAVRRLDGDGHFGSPRIPDQVSGQIVGAVLVEHDAVHIGGALDDIGHGMFFIIASAPREHQAHLARFQKPSGFGL